MLYTKASLTQEVNEREKLNKKISFKAACEGIVLLHNDGVLPLKNKNIALYGGGATKTIKGGTGSGEVKERHVVNILEGLTNHNFNITTSDWLNEYEKIYNAELTKFNKYKKRQVNIFNVTGIMSQLALEFQPPVGPVIKYKAETDTCVYVLSRQAGEAGDRKLSKGDYYLLDEEYEAIRKCAEIYEKFILIINAGSSIDLSFTDEIKGINAILFVSQLGMEMGNAVASVLSGEVNPSGKLTNTWVKNYNDIPFSDEYAYLNGDLLKANYKEGIYVGYRYYDSFNKEVRYPFGYGLSYTNFSINFNNCFVKNLEVKVIVCVKNIGSVSGKEVVQLYLSKPSGKLNNVSKELVAFKKTKLLEKDCLETLELSFNLADFASYDEEESCYILERGNYILKLGNSSRNTEDIYVIVLKENLVISKHKAICKTELPFEELQTKILNNDIEIEHHVLDTISIEPVIYDYNYQNDYSDLNVRKFVDGLSVDEMAELVVGEGLFLFGNPIFHLPGAVGNTSSKFYEKGLINATLCDGPAGIRLQKESGVVRGKKVKPIEMPMSFLEFLPGFVQKILKANPKKAKLIYQYATSFPVASALGATWNTELLYEVGCAVNREMEEYGCVYWLAPAINIQANPLCGRNFEYFSEDPFLAGMMASSIIRGVESKKGYYTTIKHFACNNQETNREHVSSNVSERALREIYTKAFKICITFGKASSVMTSYNKINGVYTPNSYDLCTMLLRSEWGFDGVVMTDWYASKKNQASHALAIKSGNDLIMPGEENAKKEIIEAIKKNIITKEELYSACYNVVKQIMNSALQKEFMEGKEKWLTLNGLKTR